MKTPGYMGSDHSRFIIPEFIPGFNLWFSVFCRLPVWLLFFTFWPFLLSVLLWFTAFDYPFGIFKLFLTSFVIRKMLNNQIFLRTSCKCHDSSSCYTDSHWHKRWMCVQVLVDQSFRWASSEKIELEMDL
jgi:hypothetical protein